MIGPRRHDDDAVDPAGTKCADELALAAGILVAAPGEDEHPARAAILDRAMEGRHERVGDVLENESDRRGLPVRPAKVRRMDVVAVVELLDRRPNATVVAWLTPGFPFTTRETVVSPTPGERGHVEHRRALM